MAMEVGVKRLFDILAAIVVLGLLWPALALLALAVFLYDFHSPFYIANRVGRDGRLFRMVKFRSMVVDADRTGVTSTSASDARITPIGRYIRAFKLDEFVQFWNVLRGDMSVVGPRPNVPSGVAVYTPEEKRLLSIRPGITDFASIVFSDEGAVLEGQPDPDLAYDQLIRPWKSRLGLYYLDHASVALDIKLIWLTVVAILSRSRALAAISRDLEHRGAPRELVRIARRQESLVPYPPPGMSEVVRSRRDQAA